MTVTFSAAAVERIIRIYDEHRDDAAEPAGQALVRVVAAAKDQVSTRGLPEFGDQIVEDLFGGVARSRALAIFGLIELGVTAGYIDLGEVGRLKTLAPGGDVWLQGVLEAFEREARDQSDPDADLTLVDRLLERYRTKEFRASIDRRICGSFESYVNLTSFVTIDRSVQNFLVETHSAEWHSTDDLSFLLSERQFASAVATGKVGDVRAGEVAGGLATLKYLDWFAAILSETEAVPELRDGILRHARWSHSADGLADRFNRWASRMAEWDEGSEEVEGLLVWREYMARVLEPLVAHQVRLALPSIRRPATVSAEGAAPPAVVAVDPERSIRADVRDLVKEGRLGAARRIVLAAADRHYRALDFPATDWRTGVNRLVRSCELLAELGSVDSAAAYLARVVERMLVELDEPRDESRSNSPTDSALEILAAARGATQRTRPAQTVPGPPPVMGRTVIVEPKREKLRSRAAGETKAQTE